MVDESLARIEPLEPYSSISAHSLNLCRMVEEPENTISQVVRIIGSHFEPALSLNHGIPQASTIRKQHRQSGGHGLKHDEGLTFLLYAGKHEQVRRRVDRSFVFERRNGSSKYDVAAQSMVHNERLRFPSISFMQPRTR